MSSWIKFFTALHVHVFRLSKGRLGNKLGKQSVLLLHTIGRRTGESHYTTLSYYQDGDHYLVVASNWGKERNPDWFNNLIQHPRTTIQIGSITIPVEARTVEGDEYQRLWGLIATKNNQYISYQKGLNRHIPIVILIPIQPK